MVAAGHRFDPEDFLQLANSLSRRQPVSEAEARTAISRAYYAVHLYARERLIASGHMTSTNTGNDHQLVVATLRRLGGMEGDGVDWLRVRRARADYHLWRDITGSDAAYVTAFAQTVLAGLRAMAL